MLRYVLLSANVTKNNAVIAAFKGRESSAVTDTTASSCGEGPAGSPSTHEALMVTPH